MDGVHDFGGTNGFGAIEKEVDEPVFHEPWEHIGYAMAFLGNGMDLFTIDEVRHAIERIEPRHYMALVRYQPLLGIKIMSDVAGLKKIITCKRMPWPESLGKSYRMLYESVADKTGLCEAYNNLCEAQNDLGEREKAVASYTRALQLKPDHAKAHPNRPDSRLIAVVVVSCSRLMIVFIP